MKPLIIANWKANPATLAGAVSLARKNEFEISKYRNIEAVVAPPFPYLIPVKRVLKKSKLGAQDVFWAEGPFTGEVSVGQLQDAGVKYVIVGHSERKIHLGEREEFINKKVKSLFDGGLGPIVCVGEFERSDDALRAVGEQLQKALEGVKKNHLKQLVIAYEPVWAVSTTPGSSPDTPDNALRAMLYIRRKIGDLFGRERAVGVRIIYGGSVHSRNITSFLIDGRMEGALVGGASLDSKEFADLLRNSARSH